MSARRSNIKKSMTVFAIFWTVAITLVSIMPVSAPNQVTLWVHMDKVVHFIFYFVASLAWLLAGYRSNKVLFGLIVLGWTIEFIQQLSGWRSGDIYDGLMNMIGAFVGWLILFWLQVSTKRRS